MEKLESVTEPAFSLPLDEAIAFVGRAWSENPDEPIAGIYAREFEAKAVELSKQPPDRQPSPTAL
jgi:hypothetical protein